MRVPRACGDFCSNTEILFERLNAPRRRKPIDIFFYLFRSHACTVVGYPKLADTFNLLEIDLYATVKASARTLDRFEGILY